MLVAAAARACGLGTARSRSMAAGAASDRPLFFLNFTSCDLWLGWRFGCALGLFLGPKARLFDRGFLSLAIFFGAAALILGLRGALALVAAASFLERVEARFLGLAKQLGLHFLARGNLVGGRRLARRGGGRFR